MGGIGRRRSERYGACFQLFFGREDEEDLGSRNKPRSAEGKAECKAETKQTHLEILQWLQAHDRLDLSIQALKRSDIEHFKKRVLDHWI